MAKYIYSDQEDRMVKQGFVRKYSIGDEVWIGDEHFTWNDEDEVYWSDVVDDKYYEEYETDHPFVSARSGKRIDFIWD